MTTHTLKIGSAPLPDIATLAIVATAVAFGTVPFFARSLTDAGMAPAAVPFYRYVFSAVAFVPFLRFGRQTWRISLWGMAAGAIGGLGWIGYVMALEALPVSTAGVIYMTYPAFTVLIGWLFFGERPGRRGLASAGMVCAAVVLAGAPAAVDRSDIAPMLLAFLAPIGFAAGINILALKLRGISAPSRIACKSLGSVLGLLPLILMSPAGTVLPQSGPAWELVAGIALITALLPQLLYNVYVPVVGAARTAMASAMELPTMFVVGWLAFGENVTAAQLAAGLIIVAAIAVSPHAAPRGSARVGRG